MANLKNTKGLKVFLSKLIKDRQDAIDYLLANLYYFQVLTAQALQKTVIYSYSL